MYVFMSFQEVLKHPSITVCCYMLGSPGIMLSPSQQFESICITNIFSSLAASTTSLSRCCQYCSFLPGLEYTRGPYPHTTTISCPPTSTCMVIHSTSSPPPSAGWRAGPCSPQCTAPLHTGYVHIIDTL